jgi:hypothetical protein
MLRTYISSIDANAWLSPAIYVGFGRKTAPATFWRGICSAEPRESLVERQNHPMVALERHL